MHIVFLILLVLFIVLLIASCADQTLARGLW